jgi:cytochrome P450
MLASASMCRMRTLNPDTDKSRTLLTIMTSFAQKNIVDMEPIIQNQISILLDKFDGFCTEPPAYGQNYPSKNEVHNLRRWLNLFTFDVIGTAAFGKSFGFLKQGDDKAPAETIDGKRFETKAITAFHTNSSYDVILAHWPQLLPLTKRLSRWHPGNKGGSDFTALTIRKVRERQENGKPSGYTDFFHHLLVDRHGKDVGLDLLELEKEAGVMINAGSDTTATAMTHCLYYVLRHPRVLEKLRSEIDAVLGDQTTAASYDQVKDLKYLRACIDESMRLRPPTSLGLPRETPPQGATIAGYEIAGNVTVSVPTYTFHRNAKLFKDPDTFYPERWLDDQEGPLLRKYVMPFSQGPRACIGRNLAYLEQQILIATLVHRYEYQFQRPDFVLPTIERFNANPADMYLKMWKRELNNAIDVVAA